MEGQCSTDVNLTDPFYFSDTVRWRGLRSQHDEDSQQCGNFGAQWHGFGTSCLRFARWVPHTRTQDSLLAAGQALPGGIGYSQGSIERFPSCFLHLIPLSQASPGEGRVPYNLLSHSPRSRHSRRRHLSRRRHKPRHSRVHQRAASTMCAIQSRDW